MQTRLNLASLAMYRYSFCLSSIIVLALPCIAHAHERFVKHNLLHPLKRQYFHSLNQDMLSISVRVYVMMAGLLFIWFIREHLDNFVENKLLHRLQGKPKEWVHYLASFLTDKPVEHPWFKKIGEWVVILFLRCPALVLVYSAANDSLVMPSFPLEPSTASVFKYAQVLMAMGIITQAFLPFGGATIIGTFLYLLYAYDWKISVDVLPVLTVAVIYVSSPWLSHLKPITTVTREQMRWVRIILGFGFFALGWMKIYNHDLTAGVADNYPHVMDDPLIKLFYIGTREGFKRENWVTAFGMAEVLTGFLVMVGAFNRFWAVQMVYIFTKLMLIDFGWAEIVHLYPIGAFLLVTFSNNLSDEFYRIEKVEEYEMRKGKAAAGIMVAAVSAAVIAFLAIFPMLYLLTLVEHPNLLAS